MTAYFTCKIDDKTRYVIKDTVYKKNTLLFTIDLITTFRVYYDIKIEVNDSAFVKMELEQKIKALKELI